MTTEMEKSSCIQLTPEEYNLARNVVNFVGASIPDYKKLLESKGIGSTEELKEILDSGQYRIVL